MEILGIGPLEALFIVLIALIAVGPKDIGKAARSAGRLLNELYRSEAWKNLSEASRSIRALPNRLAREAALEELADVKREMEEGVAAGIGQVKEFDFDLEPETPSEPNDVSTTKASDLEPETPSEPNDTSITPEGSSPKD